MRARRSARCCHTHAGPALRYTEGVATIRAYLERCHASPSRSSAATRHAVATALASIMMGQHPLLRRALSDRSLTLLFIRLPDRPKRNQEGSAQLHGIVTTLSRLAHGWEPYRPGRIQKARSIEACSDHAQRMDMAFSRAWMIARCGSGLNFWRVLD